MGELLEVGASSGSLGLISGIFCTAAIVVFALIEPGPSDDDDSNGGGGGGLMQPVA